MNYKKQRYDCDYTSSYNYGKSSMTENRDFLYHLVQTLKPERIVELGTFYGCSYFAMAQAKKDDNLDTEIIGIDTWKGDKHAGFYGEEVFQVFQHVAFSHYQSNTNRIERKTFQEASKDIPNESVDVILIDGLHTYEAVKEDYETYLPKLKKNGLILFHDTNVKRFTLINFWRQLTREFPESHYNFNNEYGFGVLAPKGELNLRKLNLVNKVAVYTAVYGGKDNVLPQKNQSTNCDFLAFTDNPKNILSGEWHIIKKSVPSHTDPRLQAKLFKINPSEYVPELDKYDYTIWIDGHIQITDQDFVSDLIEALDDKPIALIPHPERDCVYEEFDACQFHHKFQSKNDKEIAFEQMKRYKKAGLYPNKGLYAGTVFIRNNKHPEIKKFNKVWWDEITNGSYRDQLSLPYVLKSLNIEPGIINIDLWKNKYFKWNKHLK